VVAGLEVVARVFAAIDEQTAVNAAVADGDAVEPGQILAELDGRLASLLKGERTALNFLQRLSGIATHTRRHVDALGPGKTRLVDTRKTTPGWRVLEKYAVRVGGAANHRMGLFDGVLIKNNHIAVAGGIAACVAKMRRSVSHLIKIEVETASLDEVCQALEAGADVIMLDNMDLIGIREALALIAGRALVEVSGQVSIDALKDLKQTGVDLISMGSLTHSAQAVDISMRIAAKSKGPRPKRRKQASMRRLAPHPLRPVPPKT
jgi:nicotinate-nucleotide pyrophosphorylase (carboxylating)